MQTSRDTANIHEFSAFMAGESFQPEAITRCVLAGLQKIFLVPVEGFTTDQLSQTLTRQPELSTGSGLREFLSFFPEISCSELGRQVGQYLDGVFDHGRVSVSCEVHPPIVWLRQQIQSS